MTDFTVVQEKSTYFCVLTTNYRLLFVFLQNKSNCIGMNSIESLAKTPFYVITCVLDDFARLDDVRRVYNRNNRNKIPPRLPHEKCLNTVRTIIMGITSALSYMQLSIMQIQKKYNTRYYAEMGYTAYDYYRYHYQVFCHGIATIHDLYFKLIVELCDLNIGSKKMIQWEDLSKVLRLKGEDEFIALLEAYYSKFKEHEQKRNKVAHEGLIYSDMLDNYYLTNIWSRVPKNPSSTSNRPEYIVGTKENKYLLAKTKKAFVGELNSLIESAVGFTESFLELLLSKLIHKMNPSFIESHRQELAELNIECVNKYLLS